MPPHIVCILADDMGYGDVGCLNPQSRIPTPSLDALARSGMAFTDAHSNSAVCTPTRYGILTGRYAWRGALKKGVLYGYSPPLIEAERLTIAGMLRGQGYHTACIGKWHLGLGWQGTPDGRGVNPPPDLRFDVPLTGGPHTAGFAESFILPASLDMAPYCYVADGRVVELPAVCIGDSPRPAFWRGGWAAETFRHEQCLHELTIRAEACIDRHAATRPDRPLFLYLALPSPHTLHCPRAPFRGLSGAGPYGDLVAETDWSVGQIVQALRRNGMEQNTLLIFTSDNGAHVRGPDFDLEKQYGHRSSHGFRGQKSDAWDGGHRVPFLARWPARVPAGARCERTICLTDLMATAAAICGCNLPEASAEDSYDALPLLLGRDAPPRPAVVHHSINGHFAVRDGPWKLVLCRGSGGWSLPEKDLPLDAPPVQLYHLANDPGETRNLWSEHPEVVAQLRAVLDTFQQTGRSVPRQAPPAEPL